VRNSLSRTGSAILGIVVLIAVLSAGCISSPAPTPTTTQATAVQTQAPNTPAPTTQVPAPTPTTPAATATTLPPVMTTTAPVTPMGPSTVDVTIQNYAFNPASITIPAGTTVTWTNLDSPTHIVISDATPTYQVGALFMSGQLMQSQKYSFTFSTPGTYLYHCGIHPFMHGTITVT